MKQLFVVLSLLGVSALAAPQLTSGSRARVVSYDADTGRMTVKTADGETTVRWYDRTTVTEKKLRHDFRDVSESGRDAILLLGANWRADLESGVIRASRGYVLHTRGEQKARLPSLEDGRIVGILSANEAGTEGTLRVEEKTIKVEVAPGASFIYVQPTVAAGILRQSDDVRVFGGTTGGEFVATKLEFQTGDWKPLDLTREVTHKQEATTVAHLVEPTRVRHAPAESTGTGFSRDLKSSFEKRPEPASVKINENLFKEFNAANGNNNRRGKKKRRR
ncbi:MAG: hypothetical protein ACI8W8_000081 [Rhodothermales bacterium]|jgi:hypothetical protein